jgi:hypothetical protein
MPTLPVTAVLYIPTRSAPKCFVHMTVEQEGTAIKMTRTEEVFYCTYTMPPVPSKGVAMQYRSVKTHNGNYKMKYIKTHPDIVVVHAATLQSIPVISMASTSTIFAPHSLKTNLAFSPEVTTVTTVPTAPTVPKPRVPKG